MRKEVRKREGKRIEKNGNTMKYKKEIGINKLEMKFLPKLTIFSLLVPDKLKGIIY